MALSVSAVSISVSPFLRLEACIAIDITSAPSRLPASSKLACVRVEASKNMLICVSPASTSRCLASLRLSATYSSARSRMAVIAPGASGSIPRRCACGKLMRASVFLGPFI